MTKTLLPKIKETAKSIITIQKIRPFSTDSFYKDLLQGIEKLRNKNGAICAAESFEYSACWIRDQLYSTLAYFYVNDIKKFREGVWVVFDILHKHKEKIESIICYPPVFGHEYIHAKFHPETYDEITPEWGHHQLDAIGLFLYVIGLSSKNKIKLIRNTLDKELIQLLVLYLNAVRFWEAPDNGMWEEGRDLHASSIGACVAGLLKIKEENLAVVPDSMIRNGNDMLSKILPNESPEREEDLAQLSLIWPYNLVSGETAEKILERITGKLVQEKGVNRYWGDNYYRSLNGVSAEWTMGFFWLALSYNKLGNKEEAKKWFERGLATRTENGLLPELYFNGKPNGNTPLAWSHSLAIIAGKKLGI
jgi:phosphorylase kinase alpha/beta subunit